MRHPLHQPEPNILKPGLERNVSLAEATVYGVGIIVGAGIYALIGEVAGIAGNSMWMSFVLAAVVASFTALSYCELSSMFPKSAAEYTYVKNALKSDLAGFLIGWVSIFAAMVGISAVSIGFAGYFSMPFGTPIVLTAVSLIALLTIVNFLGVKESARLNLVFTIIAVLGLVVIIFMALPLFGSVDYFASSQPGLPLPGVFNNVAVAAALIFFAFIGFEDIANISEETVNARHAVPKAILISLAISTILYILVSVSVVSIVPWQELAASTAPISIVAGTILGEPGSLIFCFIALFATASTVLITLVAVSRLIYGMSSDHSLPGIVSRVHSKTKTPFVAIAFTSIIAMLFVFSGSLKQVAFVSNFGVFALFLMVNIAAIVLRFRKPKMKRPFKAPCNIGKLPVFSILGVVTILFMMSRIEPGAALVSLAAILLGIPIYFLMARIR